MVEAEELNLVHPSTSLHVACPEPVEGQANGSLYAHCKPFVLSVAQSAESKHERYSTSTNDLGSV